jgi:hypothetical protein
VWQVLIKINVKPIPEGINQDDLLSRGFAWLNSREDRPEWYYVWKSLVEASQLPDEVDRADLFSRGFAWLNDREDRSEWNYIWQTLANAKSVQKNISHQKLISLGRNWLANYQSHPGWSKVWIALWDSDPSPSSLAIFFTWLDTNYPKPKAVYGIARDHLAEVEDKMLLSQIEIWLQTNQNHPFYNNVYPGLIKGHSPIFD